MRIKRKTYQENKEKKMNKTNKKQHQKKQNKKKQPIFPKDFSQEVCLFVSYKSVKLETSTLSNDVIYYVLFMCHSL